MPPCLRIFLIIAAGLLILRALGALIDSANALSGKYIAQSRFADAYERLRPLVPLFRSIVTYCIYFTAGILILKEMGIDPTPILAGAGIVGLAVGLGAQNLINDMVCGFFILFEEHFLVGDFIRLGEAEGIVEPIDLRTTRVTMPAGITLCATARSPR